MITDIEVFDHPNLGSSLRLFPRKIGEINEYGHFSPATIPDFSGEILINFLEEDYQEYIKYSSEMYEYNEGLEAHIQECLLKYEPPGTILSNTNYDYFQEKYKSSFSVNCPSTEIDSDKILEASRIKKFITNLKGQGKIEFIK